MQRGRQQQCHIILSFLCYEKGGGKGVIAPFLPIITFFLCMLTSALTNAPFKGRAIHVYGFGHLEKVKKFIWWFT
jgi:hypothetical protein